MNWNTKNYYDGGGTAGAGAGPGPWTGTGRGAWTGIVAVAGIDIGAVWGTG